MKRVDKEKSALGRLSHAKRLRKRPRTRREVKRALAEAFRIIFPNDTVDISDGYKDNIHVVVVSRKFDKMTERQRQELMWEIVDGTVLTKAEKSLISLLYPVSPAEIK
jgi:hypothetical protein